MNESLANPISHPKRSVQAVAIAVALALSLAAGVISLWRLESWHATGMDMAWYSQALWLISQGHWRAYDTVVGYPALADAGSYILYPLGVLYGLIGQPGILLIQVLALSTGFLGIFYYAQKYQLTALDLIGWLLLYAFYPAVIGPAFFDWHPDVMMIPGFFLAIWAFENRRLRLFVIGLLIASATKDVGAAVTAVFGVGLLLHKATRYGIIAILIGLGTVLLDFFVVLPWIYPHGVAVWAVTYGWLGVDPTAAIVHLLSHPGLIFDAWTRPNVVAAVVVLLLAFGFVLPLLSAFSSPYGLPILSVFAFNALSGFDPQIYPFHQYWIPAVPFLFASALTFWPKIRLQTKWLWPWAMAGLLLFTFTQASGQLLTYHQPYQRVLRNMSHRIPPNAPVIGMNKDIALLANRSHIRLIDGSDIASSRPGTYAFLDMNDMSNELVSAAALHHWFHILRANSHWKVIAHQHNIWLFEKR
ncbi:DUF2079 domain-containing protein [Sulfobacillus sp. hq2]|uniref:DUF2079 domain-containing protein n=1 Tax=Sulfobacillus TaxID=28033 RepID=UPI000CD304E9|nr:DUF2079 domain-containing protein [Sulfobacillus sp. hq2]POB09439.1 hypothetical protein CO251_14465 [Sulfobacillus sp. hq2]